ncbi:hypothetical protein ACUN0C_11940 [Faunimonas sp. B44]|uniref:hypothetical protein n=1 Tax=Faunimonas sp. B44 TaxID=3461493 RepID=UPI00404474A7
MRPSTRRIAAALAGLIALAGAAALVFGVFSPTPYERLAAELDPRFPGRGIDPETNEARDEAMTYAAIAYAAAKAGDLDLARAAADWLVENAHAGPSGYGWGLSFAWDAFGDGSVNPADTIYGITVAFAAQGLLEAHSATGEAAYAEAAVRALESYRDNASRLEPGGRVFLYSDQPADGAYNVYNIGAYLAGQYRRAGALPGASGLTATAAEALASTLAHARRAPDGALSWPYSDFDESKPNDATHAAFFLYGLSAGGAPREAIAAASRHLDAFLEDGQIMKFPPGFESGPASERTAGDAWDLGAMMFALCHAGERQRALDLWSRHRPLVWAAPLDERPRAQVLMAFAECGLS